MSPLRKCKSRILRPFNAGKLKSADEDWIMRDQPKLLLDQNFFSAKDVRKQSSDTFSMRFKHVSRQEKLDRFIKTED